MRYRLCCQRNVHRQADCCTECHICHPERKNNNKRERFCVVDSDYVFGITKFSYTRSWHKTQTLHKQTARIKLGPFIQLYMPVIYIHSPSGNKQQWENWIHSHITDGSAYSCELWECPLYDQPGGPSAVFYFTRPRHRISLSACSTMPNTLSKKEAFLIRSSILFCFTHSYTQNINHKTQQSANSYFSS